MESLLSVGFGRNRAKIICAIHRHRFNSKYTVWISTIETEIDVLSYQFSVQED